MLSPKKQEKNIKFNFLNFQYKTGEFTNTFKQLYNNYLKHQRNKNLDLQLIYNPNKLFIDNIYQKKKEFDLRGENMNILNDLFDGRKIDIDQQKYLNHNSKNNVRFPSQTTKISHFLLFKSNDKYNDSKRKKIFKSFSQNILCNGKNQKILQFPQINVKDSSDKKNQTNKKLMTINTKNFGNFNKKNKIKRQLIQKSRKSFLDVDYYMNNNFKVFNPFKTIYYCQMSLLTTDSKRLAKNLSQFSLKKDKAT